MCSSDLGVNTSAMIEAAILGRPVLSVLAPEFAATQEGTVHFHYLLPENGGFLRIASSIDEHVGQLSDVLASPDVTRQQTARFVASFIRPHGVTRPATPILCDAIERASVLAPAPPPETLAARASHVAALPIAVVLGWLETTEKGHAGREMWKAVVRAGRVGWKRVVVRPGKAVTRGARVAATRGPRQLLRGLRWVPRQAARGVRSIRYQLGSRLRGSEIGGDRNDSR